MQIVYENNDIYGVGTSDLTIGCVQNLVLRNGLFYYQSEMTFKCYYILLCSMGNTESSETIDYY